MPPLRRVRAQWTEIDQEIQRWSQGALLYVAYAAWSFVPEVPSTPETLEHVKRETASAGGTLNAPEDDVFLLEGRLPAVVVTQTCDLIEKVQNEPMLHVALINRLPDPDEDGITPREREARDRSWRRALAGANTGRFAISVEKDGKWQHEELGEGRWFVDLRTFYPLEKGKLLQVSRSGVGPRVGVPSVLKREFALHLQERMGREELPDRVDRDFFTPLVDRLRRLRVDGNDQEQRVLNGMVREIRYLVQPADSRNYVIQLFVCLTQDCGEGTPERAAAQHLLEGIAAEFASRAIDAHVKPVRFVGADLLEMSALEYRDSTRLNWAVAA